MIWRRTQRTTGFANLALGKGWSGFDPADIGIERGQESKCRKERSEAKGGMKGGLTELVTSWG